MSGRPQGPAVRRDCLHVNARHVHGTEQAYRSDACRCSPCRLASAVAQRRRYRLRAYGQWESHVPVVGYQRRVRALAALGWSMPQLAQRSGLGEEHLRRFLYDDTLRWVRPATARTLAAMYDGLSLTLPPTDTRHQRQTVSRIRNHARRSGWLPPLCWDDESIDDPAAEPYRDQYVSAAERGIDEIAVAEAIRGRAVHLTPVERAEAVRRMTESGYSAAAIADRLGTTQRSVVRTRSARGIRGAA